MKKRALISVSDKAGIVDFARSLAELGFEILSTGGTQKALRDAGLPTVAVSDVTGFPECLDGRVKTLHPAIHAGLLAMRQNPEHMAQIEKLGIAPIDLVVINLYPFKQTIMKDGVTLEHAVENIDIGGPTMLRAAAKNWQDVAVVVDVADYEGVLSELREQGEVSRQTKFRLCYKVFAHTAAYDALIQDYLYKQLGQEGYPDTYTLTFEKVQGMRYGENPHQSAAFYKTPLPCPGSLAQAVQLHGKELSYNNIGDAAGALDMLAELPVPSVVAVKHANPCGVGVAPTVYEAYMKAYEADPTSIFGGIVVTNAEVDERTAAEMGKIFLEIVVAPSFAPAALKVLQKKKNLRLLQLDTTLPQPAGQPSVKSVYGGLLVQSRDEILYAEGERYKVVTNRAPTQKETDDLHLAWALVKHTRSNGIAVAKDGQSLGIGPGQVNRIWATQQALERSGDKAAGAALASDAFFPFNDCVRAAAAAGITAIIQPGGSLNDQESIDACNEAGIAMVFTGVRHFKH